MTATDSSIRRHEATIQEKLAFIEELAAKAEKANRMLSDQEKDLIKGAQAEVGELEAELKLHAETSRIAIESRNNLRKYDQELGDARRAGATNGIEYRSAGAYLIESWKAAVGDRQAAERLDIFHRAAAHQTTVDNPGVVPDPIVGEVLNFIDAARPAVTAFGPRPVPGGPTFYRPKVTQNTLIAKQTAQKAELASQKMLISRLPVNVDTYGGYVNVSKQDVDWSRPQIMDLVIEDLAAQYAIETEEAFVNLLVASGTADGSIGAGADATAINRAVWTAAGLASVATKNIGSLVMIVSATDLGKVAPAFTTPINPTQTSGFNAGNFGSGLMGNIAGIPVYMSTALAAGTAIVARTSAAEVYDQRNGTLSAVEPSVLGTQVAYYGYFGAVLTQAGGIQKLTVA